MNESKNSSSPEPGKQEKPAAAEKMSSGKPETAQPVKQPVPPPQKASPELPVKAVVTQAPVSEKAAAAPLPVAVSAEHSGVALPDPEAERRIRQMSRRSFLWAGAAVVGTYFGIRWLGTRSPDNGISWPFRRFLEVNEGLSRDLFSTARLAPEFPPGMAQMPRENGDIGVASEVDPDWKLHLMGLQDMSAAEDPAASDSSSSDSEESAPAGKEEEAPEPAQGKPDKKDKKSPAPDAGSAGSTDSSDNGDESGDGAMMEPAVMVAMDVIRAMPKVEMVTELKCIEGWSTIVRWGGVRFVDFMKKFPPATKSGNPFDPQHIADLPDYVSIETPDGAYYVGLEIASALHPQTLLCYEMNGKPLAPEHGAPLRLAIPVKYGIKNIKNIGTIKFTSERPRDYWAHEGYDWYAGH